MAKKKKTTKAKEPITIRFKALADGSQSIYLDCYKDGKRTYEFLKLYLVPEVDKASKAQNANTLQAANAIKSQRIIALANGQAGVTKPSGFYKIKNRPKLPLYSTRLFEGKNSISHRPLLVLRIYPPQNFDAVDFFV